MNEILELTIERPVAGGRMLGRHDGRIVFVAGAIPGERVRARVERTSRGSVWATATEIVESSPDRRQPAHDPACGGAAFAHIQYDRQRALKQDIIVDAFRRIGRITLDAAPTVEASPEHGYRLRARLHGGQGRLGFYLEGSHAICEAGPTKQLLPDASAAAMAVFDALGPRAADCESIVISENVRATERVLHLEPRERARLDDVASSIARLTDDDMRGITGVTTLVRGQLHLISGREAVTDSADELFGGSSPLSQGASWMRRAPAFFQANRFLVGKLVRCVLDRAAGSDVVDLYAGVGLFSVALAARGATVLAVEAEPFAVRDLQLNAQPYGGRLRAVNSTVEDAVKRRPSSRPSTVVLDPPRTGVSAEALADLASWRAPSLVYVSCDPPTLARDAAKLIAAGYRLVSLEGFDLFPNTPHVESVAVFEGPIA